MPNRASSRHCVRNAVWRSRLDELRPFRHSLLVWVSYRTQLSEEPEEAALHDSKRIERGGETSAQYAGKRLIRQHPGPGLRAAKFHSPSLLRVVLSLHLRRCSSVN